MAVRGCTKGTRTSTRDVDHFPTSSDFNLENKTWCIAIQQTITAINWQRVLHCSVAIRILRFDSPNLLTSKKDDPKSLSFRGLTFRTVALWTGEPEFSGGKCDGVHRGESGIEYSGFNICYAQTRTDMLELLFSLEEIALRSRRPYIFLHRLPVNLEHSCTRELPRHQAIYMKVRPGSHIVSLSITPTSYTNSLRSFAHTTSTTTDQTHTSTPRYGAHLPVVQTYSATIPVHQPSMIHQFFYVALILVGVGLLWAIVAGCSRISEWYSAKKMVDDVEPSAIALPSPTATLGRPHMQELQFDRRYGGYVSQGKKLSTNGRGFFG
ncbi:hypothetical protein C8R44DRAFT_751018 [Mycena epipterygia]|nr:hypothetical protein C8R44DRAFT_751018 [Mycena epipterygia]